MPFYTKIIVEHKPLQMEVDTGACSSLISYQDYIRKFHDAPLKQYNYALQVVTGQDIRIAGAIEVLAKMDKRGKSHIIDLIVIKTEKKFVPIIGRDWLDILIPEWRRNLIKRSQGRYASKSRKESRGSRDRSKRPGSEHNSRRKSKSSSRNTGESSNADSSANKKSIRKKKHCIKEENSKRAASRQTVGKLTKSPSHENNTEDLLIMGVKIESSLSSNEWKLNPMRNLQNRDSSRSNQKNGEMTIQGTSVFTNFKKY